MVDNHDRNMKLREENTELASKLKTFLEQYEQREKVRKLIWSQFIVLSIQSLNW